MNTEGKGRGTKGREGMGKTTLGFLDEGKAQKGREARWRGKGKGMNEY